MELGQQQALRELPISPRTHYLKEVVNCIPCFQMYNEL